MKEAFTMWRHTRMVVLTAISAAVYLAALLPFVFFTIVPGYTQVRPGAAMPVLLGLLFGPAGAWGSGLGNVIGDLLGGMFGPGSLAGFVGNFLMGYLPYTIWRALRGGRAPLPGGAVDWIVFEAAVLSGGLGCAFFIGWGLDLMKLVPFVVLGNAIAINNAIFCVSIVSVLIYLVYPRVEKWGLLHADVMEPIDYGKGRLRGVGVAIVFAAVVAGIVLGNALGVQQDAGGVGVALAPVAAAVVLGALLL